jgi:hypothetical protein
MNLFGSQKMRKDTKKTSKISIVKKPVINTVVDSKIAETLGDSKIVNTPVEDYLEIDKFEDERWIIPQNNNRPNPWKNNSYTSKKID